MQEFLILPGYRNSGPAHWQTLWEKNPARFRRVQQRDWSHPERGEWSAALEKAVEGSEGGLILVAHSLACLLVAHWAFAAPERSRFKVRAAFLVAPVDPESPAFPNDASGFSHFPLSPLPFKSLVVASTDDPYASIGFASRCAQAWESRFEVVGPKGHINGDSGLGDWPEGRTLLDGLAAV